MATDWVDIFPTKQLQGTLQVPGDKSISHRVAMLSALAAGVSRITSFLRSEDCLHTLQAMEMLGASVQWEQDGGILVQGTKGKLTAPATVLDMGNSGTGIRLLTGLLAGFPVEAELTGDASLCSRPMGRIQKPLLAMGADVQLRGKGGCAPIRICGTSLQPITYRLPVASAQVKSAVLLAGLSAQGTTKVEEPARTRDHTERIFQALGLPITVDGLTISLDGSSVQRDALPSRNWHIPADFSSAAFWLVAAAITPGASLICQNVGLNPRRTALLDVLQRMGATIEITPVAGSEAWEPMGTITVCGGSLQGTDIGGDEIPNLIDELPLLAVAGARAEGETRVRDAAELRVKESDRIRSVCTNLSQMGCNVIEHPDGFTVRGGAVRGGVTLPSYGDHRIVMSMAVLALQAAEPVRLEDTACVGTSYPGFWEHMKIVSGADTVRGGTHG